MLKVFRKSQIFPLCLRIAAATTHRLIAHNSKEDTFHTRQQLLGYHLECDNDRHHYTRELVKLAPPIHLILANCEQSHPMRPVLGCVNIRQLGGGVSRNLKQALSGIP